MRATGLALALACLAFCDDPDDPGRARGRDGGAPPGGDAAFGDASADAAREPPPPLAWDPLPPAIDCPGGEGGDLLARALGEAGTGLTLETFGYRPEHVAQAAYASALDDPFRLSWFPEARARPARLACLEGELGAELDHYLDAPHGVAGAIAAAAARLDRPAGDGPPPDYRGVSFGGAVASLAEAAGGDLDPTDAEAAAADLPRELREALAPVIEAIAAAVDAHARATDGLSREDRQRWFRVGGAILLLFYESYGPGADPADADDRRYLLGEDERPPLYQAARDLAFWVQQADLARFAGAEGFAAEIETPAGWIVVRDAAPHVYEAPWLDRDIALLIDTGGDDDYRIAAGANVSPDGPVAVLVDLAGDDRYGYPELPRGWDGEGRVPADAGGRAVPGEGWGPVSISTVGRQGCGRNGIGMLFDLGGGDDSYTSLRMSQGYAHQGVGVLLDDGGDDRYRGEAAVQGAALFGIGLLLDRGGRDRYRAWAYAQGFGWVGGMGALADGGGDDEYLADHGNPDLGGDPLYPSAQMPGQANGSFSQGAGFGLRGDGIRQWWSGGLGVLRDRAGDDRYVAGVFAQGTGYWQGTGVLSDGDGADRYDAFYYVQGGAAHYAVGVLADGGGGGDRFNLELGPRYMQMGAGHDLSVGVLINEDGDDEYAYAGLAAGSSNCNGIGLFVDNGGADRYDARSDYSTGMGNHSGECQARQGIPSIGIFLDAGGRDAYAWPDKSPWPRPADDSVFGHEQGGYQLEFGAGVDGEGETGVHAGGQATAAAE